MPIPMFAECYKIFEQYSGDNLVVCFLFLFVFSCLGFCLFFVVVLNELETQPGSSQTKVLRPFNWVGSLFMD